MRLWIECATCTCWILFFYFIVTGGWKGVEFSINERNFDPATHLGAANILSKYFQPCQVSTFSSLHGYSLCLSVFMEYKGWERGAGVKKLCILSFLTHPNPNALMNFLIPRAERAVPRRVTWNVRLNIIPSCNTATPQTPTEPPTPCVINTVERTISRNLVSYLYRTFYLPTFENYFIFNFFPKSIKRYKEKKKLLK